MTKKKSKLLAVVLCAVILATQFAMLGGVLGVSAASNYTVLNGKNDFLMGVNIHPIGSAAAYTYKQYSAIFDAKNLGSNIIRIDGLPVSKDFTTNLEFTADDEFAKACDYFKTVGDVAATKGMQVMLVANAFGYYIHKEYKNNSDSNSYTVDQVKLEEIEEHFTALATNLKGSIKYYQLGNEMDEVYYKENLLSGSGENFNQGYNAEKVRAAAVAINVARKAIKAVDPDAQVGVNFGYYHTGFIHGLKTVDCDPETEGTQTLELDYIGMDFYSNMVKDSLLSSKTYTNVIEDLAKYDEPIIVCEGNVTAESWDDNGENVTYDASADWLADFVTYCYNNDDVAGFIAYELYDQPALSEKERFFGLIDKNGNKKDTYTVLQQLFGGSDVARGEITAPANEIVGDEVTATAISGVYATDEAFETKYSDSNFLFATGLSEVDLSGGMGITESDFIEFDLYVEDAAALKAAAATVDGKLYVEISGSNGNYRTASDISLDLIKNDGWNHISLHRRKFTLGKEAAFTCVNKIVIRLKTASAKSETYVAISGMKVAVANVCKTRSNPQATVGQVVGTVFDTPKEILKFNADNGRYYDSGKIFNANLSEMWSSDAGLIEFDLFVSDVDALKKAMESGNGECFRLQVVGNNSLNRDGQFSFEASGITRNGWNHIVLAKQNFVNSSGSDWSSVTRTVFSIMGVTDSTAYSGIQFGVANFKGTKVTKTTETDGKLHTSQLTMGAYTNTFGTKGPLKTDVLEVKDFSNADFSALFNKGNLEFDFYVPDYESLMKSLKQDINGNAHNVSLYFYISSNTGSARQNFFKYDLGAQLKNDGWNHIVLSFKGADANDPTSPVKTASLDQTSIKSFMIRIEDLSGEVKASAGGDMFAMTNIIATIPGLKKPEVNNIANLETKIFDNIKDTNLGGNFYSDLMVQLDSAVNTMVAGEDPEYIEFDFYVENQEAFSAALKNGGNKFVMRLLSNNVDGNVADYNRTAVGIENYITKSGWNHIQIPFSEFTRGANTSGEYDVTALRKIRFYFSGTTSNSTGDAKGMVIAVANISATTNMIIPNDIMENHNAIIDGTSNIHIGGDGYTIDFAEPKDISNDNLFEMDIFVNDNAFTNILVMFVDANENIAMFDFTGLTTKWNHLARRLDDFEYDEGFDKTNVVSCLLFSDAGGNITVANFYTAAYVVGDGNRDSVVNILDYILMSKHIAGITSKGNIVAIDVKGNDYEVNTSDLIELKKFLLLDKWS